jgi:twitching motility protein PilJ
LDQLAAHEQQVRQEVARTVQTQERLHQATAMQKESELLQQDVGHLLQVVSAVESGDLTVQAQVSERATGLLADTLNRLIEQLGATIATVLHTAEEVTHGAEGLEHLAVSVAQNAQQQSESVGQVQILMENADRLSQDTAHQALAADAVAQMAGATVAEGQQAMQDLTSGIGVLQQNTEQMVQRVQTLGDFVQLAAQFVQDQKRVAALTQVLALNASMIATRAAGQQDPDQFASVAREFETIATQVNQLAVQTNQGLMILQQRTGQIETVVSGIGQDVQEVSHLVQAFTAGVEQSHQVFDQIQTVTERVTQVGKQVTQSSQAIATAAQTTLAAIRDIATVATETAHQSSQAREQSGQMGQLAHALLSNVQFFHLADCPSVDTKPLANKESQGNLTANGSLRDRDVSAPSDHSLSSPLAESSALSR